MITQTLAAADPPRPEPSGAVTSRAIGPPIPSVGRSPLALPADLSGWLDRSTLADLSVLVARLVDEPGYGRATSANQGSALIARQLLILLTYCYAVGLYDSQTIEALMHEDGRFRVLFGQDYPDWHALRRFRRLHHAILRRCLEDVFRSVVWYHDRILEGSGTQRGGGEALSCPVPDLSQTLRLSLVREADRRLQWAAHLDSMAADE